MPLSARRRLLLTSVLLVGVSLAFTGCAKHRANRAARMARARANRVVPHHVHVTTSDAGDQTGSPVEHPVYLDLPAAQPDVAKASAEMASAANAFLASLDENQRKAATFGFDDKERFNWHFIPKERKGLPLKEMKPEQQELAKALLKSGLSAQGFTKSEAIRGLENILKEIEKGSGPVRDPERYFFTVFGKPDAKGTWGWRFEGHHQAFNFTLLGGKQIIATPNFMGTNPHEVRSGEKKGTRVLGAEEDQGRKLVESLSDDQKKKAIFSADAPKDIITGADRQAHIDGNAGIAYAELKPEQQQALVGLIELYAHRLRDELARDDLAQIKAVGIEKVHFAWAGSLEKGKGHYYRIQGPSFLVEYDNTQNDANHVHSVWRAAQGKDFGEDLLKEHYQAAAADKEHGHN